MAEKRVNIRLAAVGGRQVKEELQSIGDAGARGLGRLRREIDAANERLARFARRARLALAAASAAATAAGVAMVRSALQTVDAQAKLAQSLGTTVASIQTLERAGELAGVAMSGIEQATKDMTRRLSQAAAGTGPAIDALERLGLSAEALLEMPLDQRIAAVAEAMERLVPAAERAAVAGQIFGEEGSIAMMRIDTSTLRQATEDLRAFGVIVSEQDADQIERTNDALSRLGLIWRGLANQLAVAAAPALEAVANAMAAVASRTGPLGRAISLLFDNLGRLATYAATFAAFLAGRWVAALAAAIVSVRGLATALVVLRGAIVRTGIGALIVGAGELIYQFGRLVRGAGGFGEALRLMGDVARAVWDGIKVTVGSLVDDFRALKADVEAIWLRLMAFLARQWADFLGRIAPSFNAVVERLGIGRPLDVLGAESAASFLESAAGNAALIGDLMRRRAGTTRAGAFEGVTAAVDALREAMKRAGEDGADAIRGAGESVKRLENALRAGGEAGKDALGATTAATRELNEELERAPVAADTGLGAVQNRAERIRRTMEDLRSTLGSAFRDLVTGAKSFSAALSDVLSRLADMAASTAFDALFSAVSRPLGGLLAGLLPSAMGNVFERGAPVHAFAHGGIVTRPTVFPMANGAGLMGEAGPEAIMPLTRIGGRLGVAATGGVTRIVVELSPDLVGRVLDRSREQSVEIVQSGLREYDQRQLPRSLDRVNRTTTRVR